MLPSPASTSASPSSTASSRSSYNESDHAGVVRSVNLLPEDPFLLEPPDGHVLPIVSLPSNRPARDDDNRAELPSPIYENEYVNYHTFDAGRGPDVDTDIDDHGYHGDEESQRLVDRISESGRGQFSERAHWEDRVGVVVMWIVALPLLLAALYICLDLFLFRGKMGSGGGDGGRP